MAKLLLPLLIAVFLSACASSSTEIERIEAVSSYDQPIRSVAVFAATRSERIRNTLEDRLVAELQKEDFEAARLQTGSGSIPWEDPSSLQQQLEARAKGLGVDAVLLVSLVRKNRQMEYVPERVVFQPVTTSLGPLASTTYMETTVVPRQMDETVEYVIKSTLYETSTAAPLWQLYSKTVNPDSLDRATSDFASTVIRALRKSLPQ